MNLWLVSPNGKLVPVGHFDKPKAGDLVHDGNKVYQIRHYGDRLRLWLINSVKGENKQ